MAHKRPEFMDLKSPYFWTKVQSCREKGGAENVTTANCTCESAEVL
jgi:hypothetical protein